MVRINVTNTISTNAMSFMSISYHDKKYDFAQAFISHQIVTNNCYYFLLLYKTETKQKKNIGTLRM